MKNFPRWFRVLDVLCAVGAIVGAVLIIVGGGWKHLAVVGVGLVCGAVAIKLGFVASEATKNGTRVASVAIVVAAILGGPSTVDAMASVPAPASISAPASVPTDCGPSLSTVQALDQDEMLCAGLGILGFTTGMWCLLAVGTAAAGGLTAALAIRIFLRCGASVGSLLVMVAECG
ncbi:MAG: hypothetical protein F4Z33_03520 [Gemmatimonadales bacterium]|nr:hypothetical protein [Gemmatimonadales bacterium]MYC88981.1 hypothetical protein [Candidatus Palauibacter denitrificans]